MSFHFEELWEKSEKTCQESIKDNNILSLLEELDLKTNLYKLVDQKKELPSQDLEAAKARVMGEILLTLTKISAKDNIDVYQALSVALKHFNIDLYSQKYNPVTQP